ncbi:hypothetical protein FDJ70_09925 [Clostridium botulinum]|uniref:Serine protease n=1 Tax=Clostridium botulinum D str. 1873 TaxID=592027 RepID=A0A9P2G6E1_CLOBO|nr:MULTISPECIES: hypothetical protein [Clostridium]AYF53470.1 hypothetical protein DFH04_01275 [Clostridium novyi]EES90810.1 conserved hypothetical protein [Clostridium botulinum D str. 1873]MBO3442558.1 hypothetical protein [Clostridium haemolyticum]MCD3216327.1 hypothetical protein [Clostridium botulinum C]MCD3246543.1 hypothetical protein [Clostridium botulinum C]
MKSNCFSLNKLNTIEDKILYICGNEYNEFFKKPNVVGIGLGYKTSGGFRTNEKCINVLVTKKVPSYDLSPNEVIPKWYKGIKTDIYESGYFKSHLLNSRVRPALGGYSISPSTLKQYGTMACIVKDNLSNYFLLSCNHVIANLNEVQLGTSIVQPSVLDNGKSPTDSIGSLYKFIPLKFNTSTHLSVNYVDAALAIISDKSLVSNKIYILGKPNNPITPSLDLSVRKAGRTTNVTYGYVKLLGSTVNLSFGSKSGLFKNQILTTLMSDTGDSGALLMDLENNPIGLVIGGSNSTTVINPINYILNALKVKIVTN